MAKESESGEEKTEQATTKKKGKEREEGNVAKSKEVSSVLLIGGSLLATYLFGSLWMQAWVETVHQGLDLVELWRDGKGMGRVFAYWVLEFAKLVLPLFLLFLVLAVTANVAQIGWLFTLKKLKPDLKKLNPIKGFKKFVSLNSLTELIKSLFKVIAVGWIAYSTIKPAIPQFAAFCNSPLSHALAFSSTVAFKLVLKVWIAMILLAAADLVYTRWDHARQMKMTKQEVKEEHKDDEGDPKVKGRIKSIQRETARKRMMGEIPTADVVITNPDHVAVAIRYNRLDELAPIVVAKGAGVLCSKIKEVAREHYVPIVRNPPLARFLYRNVELEQEIPVEVYRAVAEVLAYVYKLKGNVTSGVANR